MQVGLGVGQLVAIGPVRAQVRPEEIDPAYAAILQCDDVNGLVPGVCHDKFVAPYGELMEIVECIIADRVNNLHAVEIDHCNKI